MLNIVKHLITDMLDGYAQFANRSFALAQDDKGERAQAHLSERAGRVYGGNDGLAFARDASGASQPAKALRTGRERGKHSL